MPSVNIAIIGSGVVGSAFIRQLRQLSRKRPGLYNVVLIARSSNTLVSNDFSALKLEDWESEFQSSSVGSWSAQQIVTFLKKSPRPVILVDNTSSQSWAEAYPLFIDESISIATPNKKAFSNDLALWQTIQTAAAKPNAGLVYHEASCLAGLPVIGTLNDLVDTGDNIVKIEGIFSGTLSYIFNEFSSVSGSSVKFSDVVLKAKNLGYTEPDPRDDLNGLDVARKVTILSRLSGYNVDSPTSFPVSSLIPKPLESVESVDEFLAKLPEYDDEMDKLKKSAEAEGKVLRFVGKVDLSNSTGKSVKVGIEKYDASHPFASLKGSDNVISFLTDRYPNSIIIQGAGAGAEVTAAGVLGDVIKVAAQISHR